MVPRLWNETIEAHRREVRDAILDAAASLAAQQGLLSVTMSQVAEKAGIGRATLYKYFPDVESILLAWHERQIARHLEQLTEVRDRTEDAGERLKAVLEAYAVMAHQSSAHHDTDLGAFLHRDERLALAQQQVYAMLRDLLAEAAVAGDVREDVPPEELARYCLHSLSAARGLASEDAVRRLVAVTLAGVRQPC
jgi:AcrR family transcriptional regulator